MPDTAAGRALAVDLVAVAFQPWNALELDLAAAMLPYGVYEAVLPEATILVEPCVPIGGLPLAANLVDVAFHPRKELELDLATATAVLPDATGIAVLLVPVVADKRAVAMVLV